ncbi:MAG TPA: carboxypeptidase regulatory-like domain-containing protein [Pyrinomonadaceae bacterium]
MRFSARLTMMIGLLCCAALCASAQTVPATGTGIISGRITLGDKPAQGVSVVVLLSSAYGSDRKPTARATTAADGQFRLTNVPAGRYQVMPVAPALVLSSSLPSFRDQGKSVNLADGETIENIDFSLARGGVITGRVTDADGRPVIGESVRLALSGKGSDRSSGSFFVNPFLHQTDDRGIYRIYGIQPGRYVVSVGEDAKGGMVRMGFGRSLSYARTFHPNATDESRANVIEVTEGSEATNVDITLGRRSTTFAVSGRVIDAETGKPVPNVHAGYGSLCDDDNQMGAFGIGARSDAEGGFRFEGVLPGRYAAFSFPDEQNDTYSVPVPFEVSEGDVTGVVIKVRRGAGINGVVVIEGTSDRAILAKLPQLRIHYWPESEGLIVPVFGEGESVNADGSFRIRGLRPGKVRLMMGGWPLLKGFSLLRVERDGVEQRAGIVEVPAKGQVTGVRLIVEYGTGVVRGQVRIENGTLPEGSHLHVSLRRPNQAEPTLPGTEVDARGRFVLDGLPAGEYQLRLSGSLGREGRRFQPVVQNIQVTNGAEAQVTLVIDLNAKGGEKDDKQ